MTLVTTPGDPIADSYTSTAEADAYFTNRGETTWTGSSAVKENALRRGTTYLENQFRGRWVGLTVTPTQSLSWPRVDGSRGNLDSARGFGYGWTFPLFDINGWQITSTTVPQQIKDAVSELALLVIQGVVLEPRLVRGGQIKSIGKSVGPLRKDIVYMDGAPVVDRYLVVEGLLRGLVTSMPGSTSGNTKLVRS